MILGLQALSAYVIKGVIALAASSGDGMLVRDGQVTGSGILRRLGVES